MNKIILITFSLLGIISMKAQTTFGLKLSETSNDGTNYVVKIEMQMQGENPEIFKLGSSSLQFEFSTEALSNPVLETSNISLPFYLEPTVTVPMPNQCSFNIELTVPSLEQNMTIVQSPNWTTLGEIRFNIEDDSQLEDLLWSYNGGTTATVVYLDDEATQIFLTNEDDNYLIFEELADVGLVEFSLENPFQVFPNPMTTESRVILNEKLLQYSNLELTITNNLAQVVSNYIISPNDKILLVNRNNLPSGIYHLQLTTGKTLLVSSEVVLK